MVVIIEINAKRTFFEIRKSILLSLATGQKSINQISSETGTNWRTVDNHLVYLMGKMLVREVFSSSYVRVFELTAFGKDHIAKNHGKNITLSDNKIIKLQGEQK